MERIAQYRQVIRQLPIDLQPIDRDNSYPKIESQLIFDTEHDSPVGDATRTRSTIRCWLWEELKLLLFSDLKIT